MRWLLLSLTLLAFGMRMVHLTDVPPRWDEGWSVAHAALPIPELFSITAQDVHPPLFYLLLGAWQSVVGVNLFGARLLAVLMALPAVPLIYGVGRVWSGSAHVGMLAAAVLTWLPLHVYYSAVIRMYALAPTFILLATYALLKLAQAPRKDDFRSDTKPQREISNSLGVLAIWRESLLFVIGATGAMLTLYHAAWPLLALGLYVLITPYALRPTLHALRSTPHAPRLKRCFNAIAIALIAYLPWAIYAIPQLLGRAVAESANNTSQQYPITYFLRIGLSGLTMSQFSEDRGLWVIIGVIAAAVVLAWIQRRTELRLLILPVIMIAFTLLFVAIAARQWAFNERMLVGAVPGLALSLAWALHVLWRRKWWGGAIAALALIGVYWPTSTDFVYRKSLEVFDPYNPHTYHNTITPRAQPTDIVFFNVLSPAGFYALDRQPTDPKWSYALTWDPVKEPRRDWENRVMAYAQLHPRMWFVLYRGLAGNNGDLRGWLDSSFYPAISQWGEEEVFYGLYGFPPQALSRVPSAQGRWPTIFLSDAQLSSEVQSGGVIAVRLDWRVPSRPTKNYKIFVHARTVDGTVIAQHDAMPLNDLRPMTSLLPGETVRDNHGLALPTTFTGKLQIVMGLYDPDNGARLPTASGATEIVLGEVNVGVR